MSSAGGAAGVQPATLRRWQQGAVAGAVAAVLLLAAAAAAVRRPPHAGIALRTASPAEPPACTADDLNGLLKDGEFSWGTWEALYNESSSSGSGAVPPPWRPPWLQAKRCTLRRFTPETARKCLSGRPLVMIGDSVTRWVLPHLWVLPLCLLERLLGCSAAGRCSRDAASPLAGPSNGAPGVSNPASAPHLVLLSRYQYLTLLYFLEFGKWPAPLLGGAGAPSPVIEREWGGWTQFYKGRCRWSSISISSCTSSAAAAAAVLHAGEVLGGAAQCCPARQRQPCLLPQAAAHPLPSSTRLPPSRRAGTTEPFGEHQQCRCFREGAWDVREDRFYNSGTISASFFMWCVHKQQRPVLSVGRCFWGTSWIAAGLAVPTWRRLLQ